MAIFSDEQGREFIPAGQDKTDVLEGELRSTTFEFGGGIFKQGLKLPDDQSLKFGTDDKFTLSYSSSVGELKLGTGPVDVIRVASSAEGMKLGFYGVTPILRPTTTNTTDAAFSAGVSSNTVKDDSTFGGWTIGKVVQALINSGILTAT